jgi:hypothetical protein
MKQNETLEEVAEKYIEENIAPYSENKWMYKKCFIDGYWLAQQETSYSEEEVEELIYNVCGTVARLQGIVLNGNHLDTAYKQYKKK